MKEGKAAQKGESPALSDQVRGAVIWRSGSQLAGQLITWGATFLVVRLLTPSDYGLIAMCDVVFTFLGLMSGWGFASALIQAEAVDRQRIRQVFGLLILTNGALAAAQFALAPLAASYFRQPMVADLLRVQAALYLLMPFIALPQNLLARRLDFRSQGQVNLLAAAAGAVTALVCALAGMGVWTLIAAPAALWATRAVGLTVAAKLWIRPSFRFAGAGRLMGFGGAMMAIQFLWFVQSQADIFIAGRILPAHELGLYTTALFLTQILAAKFVPPLNEVAFAAYSRIRGDRDAMQWAFLKSIRLIMLVAMPFYLGLSITADPFVHVVLGERWDDAAPLVRILSLAMPMMTLQILFAPATHALGRAGIALRTGLAGAVLLPIAFLFGINWGIQGLSWAYLCGTLALLAVTMRVSLPVIGASRAEVAAAVAPGVLASAAMALLVIAVDGILPDFGPRWRLAIMVTLGMATYGALLMLFARAIVDEALKLLRRRPAAVAAAAVR